MAKVRVLADQVANQIAAGEVVERPASVVKELLENSIDAGASRIEVEFRQGGSSYMRIEDDGYGMSRDDALLSLERHATSKIRSAKDLDSLLTMGFRGEALPSIASVSRFQMQTREASAESGTEVLVDGGRIIHARDCGMPPGTRITVSRLFNTVPARRKFLKSVSTEAAHIVHCVRLYALAHPEIGFTLIDDGRILFQSPACERIQDRVTEIFGKQVAASLIELAADEEGMRMSGLIGKPSLSRSSRHEMLFFVNKRPVENKTLSYALVESYYGHIPRGRYPVAFLFLNLSPEAVDVNVHPAKREIRFREEARARGFAVRSILQALRQESEGWQNLQPTPLAPTTPPSGFRHERPAPSTAGAAPRAQPDSNATDQGAHRATNGSESFSAPPISRRLASPVDHGQGNSLADRPPATTANPLDRPPPVDVSPVSCAPKEMERQSTRLGENWVYLGWTQGEFAVFDTSAGLALLSVKGAEQRIWYERLLGEFRGHQARSQRLLLPQPLEFDPITSAVVEESLDFLRRVGFEVAPFGRNFFRIEGSPTWLDDSKVEPFLRELAAMLRQGSISKEREGLALEAIALRAALRAARVDTAPGREEIAILLERLFACERPLTDPEGKPLLVEFSSGEIERRFHRRQNMPAQADLF